MKGLHTNGALAVRTLAALLKRDYKNVCQEVKILENYGLIEHDRRNHVTAPHERLPIELPLTA